jgi:hypothetical protein
MMFSYQLFLNIRIVVLGFMFNPLCSVCFHSKWRVSSYSCDFGVSTGKSERIGYHTQEATGSRSTHYVKTQVYCA